MLIMQIITKIRPNKKTVFKVTRDLPKFIGEFLRFFSDFLGKNINFIHFERQNAF